MGEHNEDMPNVLNIKPISPPLKWSVLKRYEANVTSHEPQMKNCKKETIFNRVIILMSAHLDLT